MRATNQGGLISMFEDYQARPHQLLAIAWLQIQMSEEQFEQFRALWLAQATIAVVPTSSSGFRVESSEENWRERP
jgi:hypothetical protein